MKLIILIILTNLAFLNNASAYIDPGSGSIILQALLGALAAAGATISIYWNKIKNFFKKKKFKNNNNN
ncbi:hypothetical protein OAL74_01885 [Candidatus Pelagibacter sp.]|nr:hypothetical protein [Candidatus Pelagibacter sp.]